MNFKNLLCILYLDRRINTKINVVYTKKLIKNNSTNTLEADLDKVI